MPFAKQLSEVSEGANRWLLFPCHAHQKPTSLAHTVLSGGWVRHVGLAGVMCGRWWLVVSCR